MNFFKKSPSAEKQRSILPTFFVTVIFGALAGAAGTFIILPYVAPSVVPHTTYSVSGEITHRPAAAAPGTSLAPAGRAAVSIAFAKTGGKSVLSRSYIPGDSVALGVVLTSDGWVATAGEVPLPKSKKVTDLVAVVLGRAYAVKSTVRDSYSGVTFMKVSAENLPVTGFGSSDGIQAGDTLYAFDAAGGLHASTVLAFDLLPAKAVDDQLRSSEQIQRVLRVSAGDIANGSMILDGKGAIVGIASGTDAFGVDVVPIEGFSDIIGTILREKGPARPFLGLHYLDMSEVSAASGDALGRGVMVAGSDDGKIPAVMHKSPAELAGLRAGDIITSIDGDQVSSNNPLGDAIAQYSPGDTVSLSVQRGKAPLEVTMPVKLGTAAVQ